MNRKDGGKEGRTREGALSWSPEENFRERGQGGTGQGWRQGGTGARRRQARLEARRNETRRRRFSEFFEVKREKKRDNYLISNKNH